MPLSTEQAAPKLGVGGGGRGPVAPGDWHGPGEGRNGGSAGQGLRRLPRRAYYTAIWIAIAAGMMLFAAFASSYIVRRGISGDWRALELPSILWLNTAVLLASSAALEFARRGLLREAREAFKGWWLAGTALGLAFLGGQALAWRELWAQGIFQDTNPSHSFFYLLTYLHALHLVAGMLALLWVANRFSRLSVQAGRSVGADLATIYWHFLDALWIALLVLFLVCR